MDGNKEISKLVYELRKNPEDIKRCNQSTIPEVHQTFSSFSSSFEIIRNPSLNSNNILANSEKPKINEVDHCKTLTEDNFSVYEENPISSSNNMNLDYIMQLQNLSSKYGSPDYTEQKLAPMDPMYIKQENKQETKFNTGRWSAEEHHKFIEAMFLYGNEWKRVQQHIKTRSSTQARSHAQKFFIRLRKKFLEEYDESDNTKSVSSRRNEKIFSWIKETINYDTIVKLAKSSGSLLSCNDEIENLQYINKTKPIERDFSLTSNNAQSYSSQNSFQNVLHSLTPSQESFLSDRKDKMCKIILNLITNPSKTKRKSFSKEDFSDCGVDEEAENNEISNKSLNSGTNKQTAKVSSHTNLTPLTSGLKMPLPKEKEKENTLPMMKNHNNYFSNSLSTVPATSMPLPNLEIEDNTYNNYNCSDYFPFNNNNLFDNYGNNSSLFNENFEGKPSRVSSSKNCSLFVDSYNSPAVSNNNNNQTNNNSNYYNPNLNSYISIVTINLGCNNNSAFPNEDSVNTKNNMTNSENVYKNCVNSTVTKNCNLKNNENVNSSNCVAGNYTNPLPENSSNIRDVLSRKLLMMEYQKLMKNGNKNLPNSSNVISNTSHLNIINGKVNEKEIDRDKDGLVDNDPFKLTFESQASQMEDLSHPQEENDINNLNLDLEHFFSADNS